MQMRKSYIIYPKFQLTLILVNILTSLFCLIAVVIQTICVFKAMRDLGLHSNLGPDQPYYNFLDLQEKAFFNYFIVAFLIAFAISFIATVIYSHRVAGPMVRLRKFFGEIQSSGKLPDAPLKFRKNDYFNELAPVINGALQKLVASKKK